MIGFDDLYRQGDALTWQTGKEDVIRQVAELLMGLNGNSRILDFGCGTGWTAGILAEGGARYLGVDPAAEGITAARREHGGNTKVRFHQIRIDETLGEALHQAQFTHIFALDSLYFVADLERTLRSLHDALEDGGQLTMVSHIYRESPVAHQLLDSITRQYGHVQFLSSVQWQILLDRGGWTDIRRFRFFDRSPFNPASFIGHPPESIAMARELYERQGALVMQATKGRAGSSNGQES